MQLAINFELQPWYETLQVKHERTRTRSVMTSKKLRIGKLRQAGDKEWENVTAKSVNDKEKAEEVELGTFFGGSEAQCCTDVSWD